jgi:hypothetical protein
VPWLTTTEFEARWPNSPPVTRFRTSSSVLTQNTQTAQRV